MNILIVGLGSIAKKHIKALRSLDVGATFTALRSSPHAEQYEDVKNIFSLEELPEKPDFAIVSNPTHLHFRTLQALLPLQCPLFIEKPVVLTAEEAAHLRRILPPETVTYVACVLRHHPCLQFVRDHLRDPKRINEVNVYCGSYMPDWVPGKDWRQSFRADPAQSGGVHLELIHEMDYVYWLFGKPSNVSRTLRTVSSLGLNVPDYAHYTLTYDAFTASITLNYYRRDPKRILEILSEGQTWTVDLLASTVEAGGKRIFSSPLKVSDLYSAQMRYFLDCLKTGTAPMNGAAEGCDVLSLALHE